MTVKFDSTESPDGGALAAAFLFGVLSLMLLWMGYATYQQQQRLRAIVAAPSYVRPPGCFWREDDRTHSINRFCDTATYDLGRANSRLGLNGPGRFSSGRWLRVGSDAALVSCPQNPVPACSVLRYVTNKFFTPSAPVQAQLLSMKATWRGQPVPLGDGRYGYPDMF
jgi:hypothetical protein